MSLKELPKRLFKILREEEDLEEILFYPHARHRCWKVQTFSGERFFVKARENLENSKLLYASIKEDILYPILAQKNLGLRPLLIHSEGFVFPHIEVLHSGELSPQSLGKNLKSFHSLSLGKFPLHLEEHLLFYMGNIKKKITEIRPKYRNFWLHKIEGFHRRLEKILGILSGNFFSFQEGFCHSDLTTENLIWQDSRVFFIDCEYAGMTDIYWDFASVWGFLCKKDFQKFWEGYTAQSEKIVFCLEKLKFYLSCREFMIHLWTCWYTLIRGKDV